MTTNREFHPAELELLRSLLDSSRVAKWSLSGLLWGAIAVGMFSPNNPLKPATFAPGLLAGAAGQYVHRKDRRTFYRLRDLMDISDSTNQDRLYKQFSPQAVVQQVAALEQPEPLLPFNEWYPRFKEWPCILIYGPQGSGKTTFAMRLLHDRAAAGHDVQVLDPHAELGQWEPFPVVGAGMEYEAIDAAMNEFSADVEAFYRARAKQSGLNPQPRTLLLEEFTDWAEECDGSATFFKRALKNLRKAKRRAVFVSHARTLAGLGNPQGMAAARDAGLLELELEAVEDPRTGEPVPAMRGKLYLPNKKKEPIAVQIEHWQPYVLPSQISYSGGNAIALPETGKYDANDRETPRGGDVTDSVISYDGGSIPVDLVRWTYDQGISMTNIITGMLGFRGRHYSEGKALFNKIIDT